MMKKEILWFVLITVVCLIAVVLISNFSFIIRAISQLPIDRIIAYLFGAASMLIASRLANKRK